MKLSSPLLLCAALLCASFAPAYANSAARVNELDLDADEVVEAPTPDFTIPIKVNGQEVECGFWKGQDPADVAIEFGSLHQLDGKKIGRLRKALAAEAESRGLVLAEPAPTQVVPTEMPVHDGGRRPGSNAHALSITKFTDKWAKMQVATIQFAHSPFCQKFCTRENGGVLGIAVAIAMINAIWATVVSSTFASRIPPALSHRRENLGADCCVALVRTHSGTSGARMPSRRSLRGLRRRKLSVA